jgi:hypothetical protein
MQWVAKKYYDETEITREGLEWVATSHWEYYLEERKRSARWKAVAKCYHESYYTLEELVTELLEVKQ